MAEAGEETGGILEEEALEVLGGEVLAVVVQEENGNMIPSYLPISYFFSAKNIDSLFY